MASPSQHELKFPSFWKCSFKSMISKSLRMCGGPSLYNAKLAQFCHFAGAKYTVPTRSYISSTEIENNAKKKKAEPDERDSGTQKITKARVGCWKAGSGCAAAESKWGSSNGGLPCGCSMKAHLAVAPSLFLGKSASGRYTTPFIGSTKETRF